MSEAESKKSPEVDPSGIIVIDDMGVDNLVKFCDEDYAKNLKLTPDEVKKLAKYLKIYSYGDFQSVPQICSGVACILADQCPLAKMKRPPLGDLCPFERLYMERWKLEYIDSLKADWNDKIERALVMELVEVDILNARANAFLAKEGFIMENIVGINEQTGEPMMRKEEHIALRLKEKVQARRDRILKSMVATREAKAKLLTSMKEDVSVYTARLRQKAKELEEKHEKVIIAEGEIDAKDKEHTSDVT